MPIIDPSTSLGKLRLRLGDWNDPVIMPDDVYESTLDDCDNNLPRAATLIAQYILATLTMRTHERIGVIEVWGSQAFDQYLAFIKATILNPNLMSIAPIPYAAGIDEQHALLKFKEDWEANYAQGTQSDQMNMTAYGAPSIGSGYF